MTVTCNSNLNNRDSDYDETLKFVRTNKSTKAQKSIHDDYADDETHPRCSTGGRLRIPMAAHHIMSIEGVNKSKLITKLKKGGYDIDVRKNMVLIPRTVYAACHMKCQPHVGGHTEAIDQDTSSLPMVLLTPKASYHKVVGDLADTLREEFRKELYCGVVGEEKLQNDMNQLGAKLALALTNFEVGLVKGFKQFDVDKNGCAGVGRIGGSRDANELGHLCPAGRDHGESHGFAYSARTSKYTLEPGK